jgi:hypothetical protein
LFLEDSEAYQYENRDFFTQLIKETALFKLELELAEQLQRQLEFIEWHAKAKAMEAQISGNSGDPVHIEKLTAIMEEATGKGYEQLGLQEVARLRDYCEAANQTRAAILKAIHAVEEGLKPYISLLQL